MPVTGTGALLGQFGLGVAKHLLHGAHGLFWHPLLRWRERWRRGWQGYPRTSHRRCRRATKNTVLQNGVDRAAKALQNRIVRGVQNSEVKCLVRGSCGGLIVRGLHRRQGCIDPLSIILGGAVAASAAAAGSMIERTSWTASSNSRSGLSWPTSQLNTSRSSRLHRAAATPGCHGAAGR